MVHRNVMSRVSFWSFTVHGADNPNEEKLDSFSDWSCFDDVSVNDAVQRQDVRKELVKPQRKIAHVQETEPKFVVCVIGEKKQVNPKRHQCRRPQKEAV